MTAGLVSVTPLAGHARIRLQQRGRQSHRTLTGRIGIRVAVVEFVLVLASLLTLFLAIGQLGARLARTEHLGGCERRRAGTVLTLIAPRRTAPSAREPRCEGLSGAFADDAAALPTTSGRRARTSTVTTGTPSTSS